jgi:hypothetical protein
MQALRNYGEEEPGFDGSANTYSSTYHAGTGTLQLYAHHVTPPRRKGGRANGVKRQRLTLRDQRPQGREELWGCSSS